MKPRTIEQIRADHAWLRPIAAELHASFGGYSGLTISEALERVYSWRKQNEKFVEPTNLLPKNREPHRWNEGLDKRGQRKP